MHFSKKNQISLCQRTKFRKNLKMLSEKNAEKNVIDSLGLDYNYNYKNGGKTWTPKDGLKVYFLTVRLRVDFSHENTLELVSCLKAHKHYKQMLLSVEKENAHDQLRS